MSKIVIIGGGNLGSAIAKGLLASWNGNLDLLVTGRTEKNLQKLQNIGIPTSIDNVSAVEGADIVILCVLPTQVFSILDELNGKLNQNQILVSTATGVALTEMKEKTGAKVARAMPNTATSISQSMTSLTSSELSEAEKKSIEGIFSSIGETIWIEERLMQAATVLGASGIAFFLRYIRAATQGGIQMGFHPHEAQRIAVQTAIGAAGLVKTNDNHPEWEIDKVTTPSGCTIEGLNEMEHQGLSSAVIKGLMTSYEKINTIR